MRSELPAVLLVLSACGSVEQVPVDAGPGEPITTACSPFGSYMLTQQPEPGNGCGLDGVVEREILIESGVVRIPQFQAACPFPTTGCRVAAKCPFDGGASFEFDWTIAGDRLSGRSTFASIPDNKPTCSVRFQDTGSRSP